MRRKSKNELERATSGDHPSTRNASSRLPSSGLFSHPRSIAPRTSDPGIRHSCEARSGKRFRWTGTRLASSSSMPPPEDLARIEEPATSTLVADLLRQLTTLFREELALAQIEVGNQVRAAGKRVAVVAGGAVAIAVAALVLLAALILGLGRLMPGWLAALIVGLGLAGIGAALGITAMQSLRKMDLKPRDTIRRMMETKSWLASEMTK